VLISKSSAFQIFQSETNLSSNNANNDIFYKVLQTLEFNPLGSNNNKFSIGKFFNFIKFLKTICKIGNHAYDKIEAMNVNSQKLNSFEKICMTFERMEMSEGFLNIQQKTSKTHNKKTSCILSRDMLDKVKMNISNKSQDLIFEEGVDVEKKE